MPASVRIDSDTGLVFPARQIASPNFDLRPPGSEPELIVIHCISLPPGEFGSDNIVAFFKNQLDPKAHPYFETIAEMKVSAHLLIERSGDLIQFVSFNDRAWHAGQSCYAGRSQCNDFSVGIELVGSDDGQYNPDQYHSLRQVIAALKETYSKLTDADTVGHSDIAPGRKTDPGPGFDWAKLDAPGA